MQIGDTASIPGSRRSPGGGHGSPLQYSCLVNPMDRGAWGSPGKNTGVGCHALLQGIFLTQGLNLHLLHILQWQADSLSLVPPEEPKYLPIVA